MPSALRSGFRIRSKEGYGRGPAGPAANISLLQECQWQQGEEMEFLPVDEGFGKDLHLNLEVAVWQTMVVYHVYRSEVI